MYLIIAVYIVASLVYYFWLCICIRRLIRKNNKLRDFDEFLDNIEDKSYIVSVHSTDKECKRCDSNGVIHENKRFRVRVNEERVWVNELPSYFFCTKCKFKSLTLKRLTKHIGDKLKR
jgi:protein associated with RNAse G/E